MIQEITKIRFSIILNPFYILLLSSLVGWEVGGGGGGSGTTWRPADVTESVSAVHYDMKATLQLL